MQKFQPKKWVTSHDANFVSGRFMMFHKKYQRMAAKFLFDPTL